MTGRMTGGPTNMLTRVPVVMIGTAGGRMTVTGVGGKWRGGIGIGIGRGRGGVGVGGTGSGTCNIE